MMDIEIRLVDAWPKEDIVELYKAGGWWKEHYDADKLQLMVEGSFAFFVALDPNSGKAVGMGRCLSDGVSDAWIQDVVVLESHRKRGIGRGIVTALLDHCLENNMVWVGLVAEPGTGDIYFPLGFKKLLGEPMVFQPEV